MKKIILFFVFTSCMYCMTFGQTNVGNIIKGQIIQKEGLESLIPALKSNLLKLSSLSVEYNSVKIIEIEGNYYLQFLGDKYKSTFQVEKDINGVLFAKSTTTCTTSDCSSDYKGCIPGLGSYCTPCGNKGKCTKTVSSASLFDE